MRDIDKQLFAACRQGHVDETIRLLRQDASARSTDFMGVTALMLATLHGHALCVEALLPHSDAKAVDCEGASALIYASQHRRLDCAKTLVAASDVGRKDVDGLSAMDHAKGWGDEELLGLLESYRLAQLEARELASVAQTRGQATSASRL